MHRLEVFFTYNGSSWKGELHSVRGEWMPEEHNWTLEMNSKGQKTDRGKLTYHKTSGWTFETTKKVRIPELAAHFGPIVKQYLEGQGKWWEG